MIRKLNFLASVIVVLNILMFASDSFTHPMLQWNYSITNGFIDRDPFILSSHFYIALCLGTYILANAFRSTSAPLQVICIVSLGGALFTYCRWTALLLVNSEYSFADNFTRTVSLLDLVSLVLVLLLAGLHVSHFVGGSRND